MDHQRSDPHPSAEHYRSGAFNAYLRRTPPESLTSADIDRILALRDAIQTVT